MQCCVTVTLCLAIIVFYQSLAAAQELGPIKTYGDDGRLFSSGNDDYYLLSIRSYVSEDSSGYQGKVRIVKKYPGGGYELKFRDFIARCNAPFDHEVQIMWSETGKDDYASIPSVPIKSPNKLPSPDAKESYNLYWAACFEKFQRFR